MRDWFYSMICFQGSRTFVGAHKPAGLTDWFQLGLVVGRWWRHGRENVMLPTFWIKTVLWHVQCAALPLCHFFLSLWKLHYSICYFYQFVWILKLCVFTSCTQPSYDNTRVPTVLRWRFWLLSAPTLVPSAGVCNHMSNEEEGCGRWVCPKGNDKYAFLDSARRVIRFWKT